MKRLPAIALVVAVLGLMVSCGYKRPQSIPLPAADSLSIYTPRVDSAFGQYAEIVPEAYVLDLTDTIPAITVKVRFLKNVVTEGVDQLHFFPDSTALVLVDSLGAELPYMTLVPDSVTMKRFSAMITNGAGSEGEFRFLSVPVTDSIVQLVEANAKSVKLKGFVDYKIDAATIDRMLSQFEGAISSARSALAAGNGHVYGYNMMVYTGNFDAARLYKNRLARIVDKMTPAQRQRFESAERRRPKNPMP